MAIDLLPKLQDVGEQGEISVSRQRTFANYYMDFHLNKAIEKQAIINVKNLREELELRGSLSGFIGQLFVPGLFKPVAVEPLVFKMLGYTQKLVASYGAAIAEENESYPTIIPPTEETSGFWTQYAVPDTPTSFCSTCFVAERFDPVDFKLSFGVGINALSISAPVFERLFNSWVQIAELPENKIERQLSKLGVPYEIDEKVLLHLDEKLTSAVTILIDALSEKMASGLLVERLNVESFVDNDTGIWEEIIFHIFVKLDSQQANQEWDNLRDLVSYKASKLRNPAIADALSERIGIRFSWVPRKHV